jgi:LmbE family N-acetylglucosaminyl deacetylase
MACGMLGAGQPTFLGFPCNQLDTVSVAEMADAVAEVAQEPDLILTHWHRDLNRDHRLVSEIARIFGRPRPRPVAILECEIPSTAFWNGRPFLPNYFVDITEAIDTKIEAFAKYENEIRDYPHPWSHEALRLLAQYHGMQCGYAYAEAFFVARGYAGLLP